MRLCHANKSESDLVTRKAVGAREVNEKMSRALYRGATPERTRTQLPSEEPGSPTKARDELGTEERGRSRPVWETCFPHSVRLWIKQNLSFSSGSHKHGLNSAEAGLKVVKIGDSPGRNLSLNSSSGGSSDFMPNCGACLVCSRKPSAYSILPLFLICLIGALALMSVTRMNRPILKVDFPPYNSQRAQLLAWKDLLRGGILGTGSLVSKPREVVICQNGTEDYIPCYNVTANLEAGYSGGREYERHCELSGGIKCLVPAPKDYKILLKWPDSSQGIWRRNLKIKEAMAEQKFIAEENLLRFPEIDQHLKTRAESHVQRIAVLLGLSGIADFLPARVRTVLDIGCGFGSLSVHLWGHDLLTMCVGPYKKNGGPIQVTLERGFPAMVVSLGATQMPYPSSSYDVIHCAGCGLEMRRYGGLSMLEVDRVLRVGGYFVWFIPAEGGVVVGWEKTWKKMQNLTSTLGWKMISPPQSNAMVIWQKMSPQVDKKVSNGHRPLYCERKGNDGDWAWNQPLRPCITLPPSHRQISLQEQLAWPSRLQLADTESATSDAFGRDAFMSETMGSATKRWGQDARNGICDERCEKVLKQVTTHLPREPFSDLTGLPVSMARATREHGKGVCYTITQPHIAFKFNCHDPSYRTRLGDPNGWSNEVSARRPLCDVPGPQHDEATGEPRTWTGTVSDYWSLLTPIIFSDHPKRLVDEEVGPNANLVRNVMDMNAGYGALNAALTMSEKQVWVMNVIPTSAPNTLPFIFDRGLIGALHDWCEPFPTYPRTYDFLHGVDLLSQELKRQPTCGLASLFLEMDRMLRPEGWVFLRDDVTLIEDARSVANQMHWESRLVKIVGNEEQRLLVCQKSFWKI